ncbi:helix-turn-helix domain-containing protein [Saccharomonospora amisosensis]|uniref:helix-turn-helix domain-containing protein n=1 Tax=Saccharomonospora amisosensis TaxID=1128677 RepID=UPI00141F1232
MDSPWLTVDEAATRSRRHNKTVLRALRRGELRGHQARANGRWLIHVEDLDLWVRGERPTGRTKVAS